MYKIVDYDVEMWKHLKKYADQRMLQNREVADRSILFYWH